MSVKRKAVRLKEKREKQIQKLIYKEEMIEKFHTLVHEYQKKDMPEKAKVKMINDDWAKYITERIKEIHQKSGRDEAILSEKP